MTPSVRTRSALAASCAMTSVGGSAPTVASSRCAAPPLRSFLAPFRPFGWAPRPHTEDGGWFGKQTILFYPGVERSCRPVRNVAKPKRLRRSDSATRQLGGDSGGARSASAGMAVSTTRCIRPNTSQSRGATQRRAVVSSLSRFGATSACIRVWTVGNGIRSSWNLITSIRRRSGAPSIASCITPVAGKLSAVRSRSARCAVPIATIGAPLHSSDGRSWRSAVNPSLGWTKLRDSQHGGCASPE